MRVLSRHSFALICYVIVSAAFITQGLVYYFSDHLMTYHMTILNTDWDNLSANSQHLILSFQKGSGIGAFFTGILMLIISLIPFRKKEQWAKWTLAAVGIAGITPLFLLTKSLNAVSGIMTPYPLVLALLVILVIGFLLSLQHDSTSIN
ncbi:MAG: hypothetical protein HN729_03870 [Candidatus Marinimicrobia bacterium]|nr:hypothetical protein [Candidatus Neomarinimicrobiota bacterium]MBT3635072.1 hypothetical protein [Candidatus Neomarinimicrobiota bacterium]MBT3683122.1 hypothetical protein [Candidatus Neomarinimicrobiota bacterium]MBT3760728.1 hypothetical protein [Candidatus Neomarinimicrobiota bacterium]MBT3896816.1 hypothetical protein [Candidatus Neomarinimicrobiota bacterium]